MQRVYQESLRLIWRIYLRNKWEKNRQVDRHYHDLLHGKRNN